MSRLVSVLQPYFDVDTLDVKRRIVLAVNPLSNQRLLSNSGPAGTIEDGKIPDLWGPVWVYQTLVFAMFFSTTVAGMIYNAAFSNGGRYEYSVELLGAAAGMLAGFTFLVPCGMWLLIQYLNLVPSLTLVQTVCLYGYANAVWVPVILICGSPLVSPYLEGEKGTIIVRWILGGIGFLLSGKFLVTNLKNVIFAASSVDVPKSKGLVVVLLGAVVHGVFTMLLIGLFGSAQNFKA